MTLHPIDWAVIVAYLAGMIGLSAWLSRGQRDPRDYYLAGNRFGPLPIALSTMATQLSTNSLLGVPAFVAFAAGGGLVWLQYELAVPLAMIALMAVLFPVFRSLRLISVYEYAEKRFGVITRTVLSVTFQFLRAFSTGVTVYGVSLVIGLITGLPFWASVLLLGGVTVIYDVLGGMKAVILSDVLQLILLGTAILAAGWVAVELVGGWSAVWANFDDARKQTLDLAHTGLGDGRTFAFWPMLIGGFFLYVAYYGVDQTQAQRSLSTRSEADTTRALFLGGLLRFPLVLLYSGLGVAIAAYATTHPEFIEALISFTPDAVAEGGEPDWNLAVPVFVLEHFPIGLVGLVMVGLIAAAMSSLDSTLNSLSAVTLKDLVERFRAKPLQGKSALLTSKGVTLFWGVATLTFAFFVSDIAPTIVEAVNKIGSLINGPLLGVFVMGLLLRRANEIGALTGFALGFVTNLLLWIFADNEVSWLWWNLFGFLATFGGGIVFSLLAPGPANDKLQGTVWDNAKIKARTGGRKWMPFYLTLAGYFVLITLLLAWIEEA